MLLSPACGCRPASPTRPSAPSCATRWRVAVWAVANRLRLAGSETAPPGSAGGDPLAALRALPAFADPDSTALLLLHNFHRFMGSPEVIQTAFVQLVAGKQQRTFLVVLSPVVQIPIEL